MKTVQKTLLTLLFIAPLFLVAQQLDQQIPANVQAVATVNGEELFSAYSVDKFNTSKLGQEIIKELKRDLPNFNGIQDFGIDLDKKGHFYYQMEGEVSYFSFLLAIDDYEQFSNFFAKVTDLEEVENWEGKTIMIERDVTLIFDQQTLQICFSDLPYDYIDRHEEELSKKYPNLEGYELRREVSKDLISSQAKRNYASRQSITSNRSYKSSHDKNADASVWIKNYGGLMNDYYQAIYGYQFNFDNASSDLPDLSKMGIGAMSANLYFNDGNMQIKSEMEFSDALKSSMKKIYKQKMNKSFYNYVNLDTALGYMTYSLNTENMMQEYPNLLVDMYGGVLPGYQEEMDVVAELFTTLIDEKAIGELLTGNALFVMEDIGEKEVAYVTYEYDEEYNEKKVTKKKKEILPDFTMILGTKRKDLATKLAKLGVKYDVMTGSANRFKLNASSDIPLDLYMLLTNDAIILSTRENGLGGRAQGTSSATKKRIDQSGMIWHVNMQKIMQRAPLEELGMDGKSIELINKNFKSATLSSSKIKGNTVSSEFKVSAPDSSTNSLQLLMDFFEDVM